MTTVVIPTINDERTIAEVVKFCKRQTMVSEVIVADDHSADATVKCAESAGARIILNPSKGRGLAMKYGIEAATNELIVFMNAAFDPYPTNALRNLVNPLLKKECDFVQGTVSDYSDHLTEFVVRPLLKTFFPALAAIQHPIAGIFAAPKSLFQKIEFSEDYGAPVMMLIDMHQMNNRIREVNIGPVDSIEKSWHHQGAVTAELTHAILKKAIHHHRNRVNIEELGHISTISGIMQQSLNREISSLRKLLVFDMDNTLLKGRFIDTCAERFGFDSELLSLRKTEKEPAVLTKRIARLLKGISSAELLKIAGSIPIVEDAVKVVEQLKLQGYVTGIISDSYQLVVDFVKNKIGADFALGNQLEFYDGKATGEVTIPSFFYYHLNSKCGHALCKTNALIHMGDRYGISLSNSIAVGDSENDLCMIERAGMGIAFCTDNNELNFRADKIISKPSFHDLLR